jgi:YVTN family beta-propeller protein
VVNEGANSVTELDASTGAVVQTIGVGNFDDAVSSDGIHVWVANSGDNTVTELDASTGAVVQTIGVGSGPEGISSDNADVWVANYGSGNGNTVTELDASTGAVVQTIGVGNFPPNSISSDGTHVWVASFDYIGSSLTELGASTGAVIGTIGVGKSPDGVSSDGTHVWVANGGDDTVTEIAINFPINFAIVIPSLPAATPGTAYGPVTLQAVNLGTSASPYVTTLKWKKVTLPKGLRLSSTGVLSGTPNRKLIADSSSVTVQVTETVTTLNGKKKVKTKTTVQATIPLTIY